MIFYPDCDYFDDKRDDDFSPYPGECEDCYRYEICMKAWYEGNKVKSEVMPRV